MSAHFIGRSFFFRPSILRIFNNQIIFWQKRCVPVQLEDLMKSQKKICYTNTGTHIQVSAISIPSFYYLAIIQWIEYNENMMSLFWVF